MLGDAAVVENLEKQNQIRYHTSRLRQMGLDEQTIDMLIENLRAGPPESIGEAASAPGEHPAPPLTSQNPEPKTRCAGKRPIARVARAARLQNPHGA